MDEISIDFYHESLILSAILEAFVYCDEYLVPNLNTWVFAFIEKGLFHRVTLSYYNKCVAKLYSLGLIEIRGNVENANTIISITKAGKDAVQNQTFASLSQTALFNYQANEINKATLKINEDTLRLNNKMKRLSCATLITAVVSAFVSILALIISIRGNCCLI